LHYGYPLRASVSAGNFTSKGFDLFYKLETTVNGEQKVAALAITTMVCYDYEKKKVVPIAEKAVQRLAS
jgi:acyl-CoA thioesterase FadM